MYSLVYSENASVVGSGMSIKPIRSESDYRQALQQIDELTDAMPMSEEQCVLDILNELVFAYEERHMPGAHSEALAEIRRRMADLGLSVHDLEALLRSPEPMEEVLTGKKPLTLRMMRTLHRHLGVAAEVLLR